MLPDVVQEVQLAERRQGGGTLKIFGLRRDGAKSGLKLEWKHESSSRPNRVIVGMRNLEEVIDAACRWSQGD